MLDLLGDSAKENNDWGIDYGVWSVLSNMYPDADIPVVMIGVNLILSPKEQFEIGEKLKPLREEGALILASGNIVYNLSMVDWRMDDVYDWAQGFDDNIKDAIINRDYEKIMNCEDMEYYNLAVPSNEHFIPFLNVLGLLSPSDKLIIFNENGELGSITMTSFIFED
ncbi:MAG: dioxygenase [Methanobrevibacter sp.]